MIKKTVIINRAVPGSGKTTITNCIVNELKKNNINIAIHSTDEYFMVGNRYIFDIEKLHEYHQKNLKEFKKSITSHIDIIICDNTNIAPWQTEDYTKIARDNDYQIIFITLDPRELSKHVESQKITPDKPDAHEVEEEILKRMIEEYYIYDDLLNPRILIDKEKHVQYKWDIEKHKKIVIGMASHFDSDFIIRILPNEYKKAQENIGSKILQLIKG
ncbi:ATP-binding protein [Aliarcobacter cryaerophilus]|uniref:nucleoside-triphosphatase n=1 Tax=Aliarcobacter cryaerophilus TaxID=28198 RepID=UPI003DA252B3